MDEIPFYCHVCGISLCALAEGGGGFCECPQCLRVIPVPGYSAQPDQLADSAAAGSPHILGIEIKFLSGCCGNKIRVDARRQGLTLECPVCHQPTKVPEWSGSLRPQPPAESPARRAAPLVRLSREECDFLSAPMNNDGSQLLSAANR